MCVLVFMLFFHSILLVQVANNVQENGGEVLNFICTTENGNLTKDLTKFINELAKFINELAKFINELASKKQTN
jgi:hypothetical protein